MSENGENGVKTFKNVDVHVSEFKVAAKARGVWELRNWNDPQNFPFLVKHANCVLSSDTIYPFAFRFFLQEQQIEEPQKMTKYLSLHVMPVRKEADPCPYEKGSTAKFSVQFLNKDYETIAPPSGYHSFSGKYLTFENPEASEGKVLAEKFIILANQRIPGNRKRCMEDVIEKPATLRFGISIELFKCSELKPTFANTTPPPELSVAGNFKEMDGEDTYFDLLLSSKDGVILGCNSHHMMQNMFCSKLAGLIKDLVVSNVLAEKLQIAEVDANPLSLILNWITIRKLDDDLAARFLEQVDIILPSGRHELLQFYKLCDSAAIKLCQAREEEEIVIIGI